MKIKLHSLIFKLIVGLIPILGFSQCPTTAITLSSQAEVDAFTTNYPGCTDLDYKLTINGSDITDLTPLSGITSIHSLWINDNPLLPNLNGLESIIHIDGYDDSNFDALLIVNNSILTDISALSNMSNSGLMEGLSIQNNPMLASLNGLQGFNNVIFTVYIFNNDSLIDLTGLNNITGTDNFDVVDNDNLINLNGLDSFNAALTIQNNNSLQNLIGLTSSFESRINLLGNPNIQSLFGLEAVSSLSSFFIDGNELLSDISAIPNITSSFGTFWFEIKNNPNLSTCHVTAVCSAFNLCNSTTDTCQVIIENNSFGCNSIAQVSQECGLVPSNDDCENAIDIDLGQIIEAYNDLSTQSPQVPSCNDLNRIDVWFKVNSESFSNIDIIVDTDYNIQLWEGTCSNLTQVVDACGEGVLMDISVNTNTDYYIQVWSDSTIGRMSGLFNIVVQDATLSTVESEFAKIKLYPNPTRNILNLKSPQNIDFVNITNFLGQQILRIEPNTTDAKIDLSNLNSGMYLILIQVKGKSQTYRITKS